MIILCIIGIALTLGLSIFIYKTSKKQVNCKKGFILALCAMVILAVGLEATLFNINYYTSKGYEKESLSTYLEGYKTEDGCYTLSGGDTVDFSELNIDIKNIQIDLNENNKSRVKATLYLTDEANKYYYATPEKTIYKGIEKSEYMNVHTSGKSESIQIAFSEESGTIKLDGVYINCERAFNFSLLRIIILVAILVFIYIFKPSSPLYKIEFQNGGNLKHNLTAFFLMLQCFVIAIIGTMNPIFLGIDINENGLVFSPLPMEHHNQYDELAQAMLDGKVYIDNNDVPQSLKDMENPYDTTARSVISDATGDSYRWDVAYYNGHYYVYFGIVPLLIMYLPFRVLFKAPFPSAVGIILFAIIIVLLIAVLLIVLTKKDEPAASAVPNEPAVTTTQYHLQDGALMYDSGAVALSEDGLQERVDEMYQKAKEGTMALQFKNTAFSSDGRHFTCEIGNSIKNNYDMFINIYKDSSLQEQILLTGLIPPGQGIESFESEIQLDPGTYEALLVLTQVKDDHATLHAQLNVVLTLEVEDYTKE